MAAEAAARPSREAAATETRVWACSYAVIKMEKIDQCSPSSVHLHGLVIISHEHHKIGDVRPRAKKEPPDYDVRKFDYWTEVKDPSLFRSYVSCRDLIHRILAEAPVTRDYDLAADNWDDFEPHVIATAIVADVRRDTEDARGVVPAYAISIGTDILVTLIYSEPKALLLACRAEIEPAGALTRGRKRRRRRETAGELCAICFSDVGTQEEETVRLPCSHPFHRRCIAPWFHRTSTCPTCRHDAMENFGFVRSVSIEGS